MCRGKHITWRGDGEYGGGLFWPWWSGRMNGRRRAADYGGWEGSDKDGLIMRWVDAGLLNRGVLISSWDGFTPAFARDFPALALEKFFPGLRFSFG